MNTYLYKVEFTYNNFHERLVYINSDNTSFYTIFKKNMIIVEYCKYDRLTLCRFLQGNPISVILNCNSGRNLPYGIIVSDIL